MSVDTQFLQHLATVRPGMPAQDLRAIIGTRWREPSPHDAGMVRCIEGTHGFAAQVDRAGIVGRVQFGRAWSDPSFSSAVAVAGLRIGMSIAQVQRAQPGVTIRPFAHPMPTAGTGALDQHTRFRLQFLFDELRVIELVDDRAVFPARSEPAYRAPAGAPGAPFGDPNFKLVVMNDLLERNIIDLGTPRDIAQFAFDRPFDQVPQGHALLRPVYDYLVRYPLADADLAAAQNLSFDGGNRIYSYAFPSWDGETDDFEVHSLDGIERLANLESFAVTAMLAFHDFSRLAGFQKLRCVDATIGRYENLNTLLGLSALAECRLRGNRIYDDVMTPGHQSRSVMETLRGRGVRVWVHWVSRDIYPDQPPDAPFE